MSPRTGRRGGSSDTRGDIVAAARALFAELGYDGTSLRAVAREAGVDPALVHHYFDGKPGLFVEALELPFEPAEMLGAMAEGPREHLGDRIARLYVQVWEGPGAEHLIALLRSAMSHDAAARMLREFMTAALLEGVAATLDVDQPARRAALCATQIVGMGVLRGVLRFEPLVAMDAEEVVAWLGPQLQRYLTGPSPPRPVE